MSIKVIRTEEEYEDGLALLAEMASKDLDVDSEEFSRFEVLSILIEKYENEHVDVGDVDPIEAIKFRMDQQDLTNKDLAQYIGSVSRVSEILNGKRALSLAMIRALHKGLGIPYESLMGEHKPVENIDVDWNAFPINEMAKRGLFGEVTASDVKIYAEEYVRAFLGARVTAAVPAYLRAPMLRSGREMDRYALFTWSVRSLQLAETQSVGEFDLSSMDDSFFDELAGLSFLDSGPKLAFEYLKKFGIRLVTLEHFKKTYLDGAALVLEDRSPVVSMTLRHDRLDNFWFVLFHELAHVKLHLYCDGATAIYDDLDLKDVDGVEREADELAVKYLIPSEAREELSTITRAGDLNKLSKKFKRNPAIFAGYLRNERNNYRIFNQMLGRNTVREVLGV